MNVIEYTKPDQPACLAIFDSNVPTYFLAAEREEFASFLGSPPGTYLVLRDADRILGCGGIARKDDALILCWGMIHRDFHRKGLGSALLAERLRIARDKYPQLQLVKIETSQHSAPFFAKLGFQVEATTPNGFGPGLDCLSMTFCL